MLKKGMFNVAKKSIFWMIMGVVMAIVILAFAFTIANYKNKLTEISPKLTSSLIAMRFANIPECFAYQDPETGRTYPGIIDLVKFTEEHLEASCYKTETNENNFKLILRDSDREIITNNYYNHFQYEIDHPVLVRQEENLVEDLLTIKVQVKT
jgi:hypothetical protein